MNKQITVNFENLNEDERNQLMNLVTKANTPKKWWEGTIFDIDAHELFFYVSTRGNVDFYENDSSDYSKQIIAFGNGCKDKNYMQQRAKEIERSNLVANFAEVVNDGWRAKWKDSNQCKFYIIYDEYLDKYAVAYTRSCNIEGATFFKSEELAQRCIDEVLITLDKESCQVVRA